LPNSVECSVFLAELRNDHERVGLKMKMTRKVWRALRVVVFLVLSTMGQACSHGRQTSSPAETKAAQPADVPACNGTGLSSASAPSRTNPHPHSVTLSWNAAVPASKSPQDAIKGYYVYRSPASQTYPDGTRISQTPVSGTRCIDTNVEARTTYFYVVRAVTEGGRQSGSSLEIKATVPFP
jgi:hypothetical protein